MKTILTPVDIQFTGQAISSHDLETLLPIAKLPGQNWHKVSVVEPFNYAGLEQWCKTNCSKHYHFVYANTNLLIYFESLDDAFMFKLTDITSMIVINNLF